jgi:L-ascorbate metabolism protein UlaG (beta-lactamase superfamily)
MAGEPGGYVVKLPGGVTLYHAGDTAVFGDMKLIGEIYRPDVAYLPIGDVFTMGPREAAYAIRLLGVKYGAPMHFATFPCSQGLPRVYKLRRKTLRACTCARRNREKVCSSREFTRNQIIESPCRKDKLGRKIFH